MDCTKCAELRETNRTGYARAYQCGLTTATVELADSRLRCPRDLELHARGPRLLSIAVLRMVRLAGQLDALRKHYGPDDQDSITDLVKRGTVEITGIRGSKKQLDALQLEQEMGRLMQERSAGPLAART